MMQFCSFLHAKHMLQEVLKAREKRAELARAHDQIVRIQASVRMFLARRYFKRLREAATCALLNACRCDPSPSWIAPLDESARSWPHILTAGARRTILFSGAVCGTVAPNFGHAQAHVVR